MVGPEAPKGAVKLSYEIEVKGTYLTSDAHDKKEAVNLALHHFHAELMRWADGKQLAGQMWDIRVVKK